MVDVELFDNCKDAVVLLRVSVENLLGAVFGGGYLQYGLRNVSLVPECITR